MPNTLSQLDSVTSSTRLDELVAMMSARIGAGASIDLAALTADCPELREQLEMLLPTLQAVAEFEQSFAHVGESLRDSQSVERGSPDPAHSASSMENPASSPGLLGDFRILRELGRGGMGVVYEARQILLNRRVALKVLPLAAMLDGRRLERFRHEAQAAAMLRHPHIVTVYSVGCERGVHYYAMDYVEGPSLADVVDQTKASSEEPGARSEQTQSAIRNRQSAIETVAALSTLRTNQRAEYFRSVAQLGIQAAEALDYAHQMGVVHRDVKPSNLLLDPQGNLWITDFGLAMTQSDAGLTMTGDLLGTLRYMSPEQAAGKRLPLDHRTDIYSLGITLYELAAGRPAFDSTDRAQLLRSIAEVDPPPLEKLVPTIPTDLATIVHKAIEKDAADRYNSAQQLAEDLRAFLENKPIRAKPPNIVGRSVKWSRRHIGVVWGTAAVLFISTTILIGASLQVTKWYREAVHQRSFADAQLKESQKQEQTARAVSDLLLEMLGSADPDNVKGANYTVRELLDDFSAGLSNQLSGQPEVEAKLRATIGKAYWRLGLADQAEPHLRSALELLRAAFGPDHMSVADRLLDYAWNLGESGRPNDAIECTQEAIAIYRRNGSPREPMIHALWTLQRCLVSLGKYAESDAAAKEALSLVGDINTTQIADVACIVHARSDAMREQGNYAQAETLATQALNIHRRLHGAQHPETAWGLCTLGEALRAQNKLTEAESAFREAIAIFGQYYSGHSIDYPMDLLAKVLRAKGGRSAEQAFWEEAVQDFPSNWRAVNNLAWLLASGIDITAPERQKAIELAKKAIDLAPQEAGIWHTLGVAYYRNGNWQESIEALRKGVQLGNPEGSDWFCLALAEWQLGNPEAARESYVKATECKVSTRPRTELLARFRAKADELLGVLARPSNEPDSPINLNVKSLISGR